MTPSFGAFRLIIVHRVPWPDDLLRTHERVHGKINLEIALLIHNAHLVIQRAFVQARAARAIRCVSVFSIRCFPRPPTSPCPAGFVQLVEEAKGLGIRDVSFYP